MIESLKSGVKKNSLDALTNFRELDREFVEVVLNGTRIIIVSASKEFSDLIVVTIVSCATYGKYLSSKPVFFVTWIFYLWFLHQYLINRVKYLSSKSPLNSSLENKLLQIMHVWQIGLVLIKRWSTRFTIMCRLL